jgi:ElaB/YqjD/DUF883 family membrane-anchored ribosome-binding protein
MRDDLVMTPVAQKNVRDAAIHLSCARGNTQAKARMDSTLGKLDSFYRARPFVAVGCAFAAGVVTAVLLRR